MIINREFKNSLSPFLTRIEVNVNNLNIPDKVEYIKSGNWKRRAGGRDLKVSSSLKVISSSPDLIVEISNPQKDFTTWFPAIGKIIGNNNNGGIQFQKDVFHYSQEIQDKKQILTFYGASSNAVFISLIKRALYKATFCINCEACEVECPTGALSIIPEAKIDKSKCIHCQKCLTFHELGCIVANSLEITNSKSTKMKLIGYNNFGLKEEWLDFFMLNHDDFFKSDDHGLNVKEQLPSFTKWLIHAGIIDNAKNKKLTALGILLTSIYRDNPSLVWEIIWINLTYASPIAAWYAQTISYTQEKEDLEIRALLKNDYPDTSDTSIKNIVYAMLRTLKESPIGEDLGQYVTKEKSKFIRLPHHDLSREAIAYSLYKYSEFKGSLMLRVANLFQETEHGIKVEFGIDRNLLLKNLRSLSSDVDRVLIAELNMGLDHITLREDLTPVSVLEQLTK